MKTVQIQIPDWMDENFVKKIVVLIIQETSSEKKGILTQDFLNKLSKILEKTKKYEINEKMLEEIFHERFLCSG